MNARLIGFSHSSGVHLHVCADDSTPCHCWPSDGEEEDTVSRVGLVFLTAARLKDSTAFDLPCVLALPLRQHINCFFHQQYLQ